MLHRKKHEIELSEASEFEAPKKKWTILIDKIGKRNLAIAGTALIIGVAVFLNWIMFSGADKTTGYDGYDQPTGSITTPNTNPSTQINATDTYFSATQVSRQRARDEAIEVLQAVVDNVDASETAKTEALASIAAIADEIQKESNIESLITAKGFEQCIAVLNGDQATIVVSADTLQPADLAQINTIVYEQTGILPSAITIVNK